MVFHDNQIIMFTLFLLDSFSFKKPEISYVLTFIRASFRFEFTDRTLNVSWMKRLENEGIVKCSFLGYERKSEASLKTFVFTEIQSLSDAIPPRFWKFSVFVILLSHSDNFK